MRDPSTSHGIAITHFCVARWQCVKKCCMSNRMEGADDMLWNGSVKRMGMLE
jgi:hypothetical protein